MELDPSHIANECQSQGSLDSVVFLPLGHTALCFLSLGFKISGPF